jgi:glucose/arabinose dehydrogenase
MLIRFALIAATALVSASAAHAQLRAELVTAGLTAPVAVAQDPSNPNRQLIAEQSGRVRVVIAGVLQAIDFLDLRGVVSQNGGEQGLLGIAFAPHFGASGRVFVNYTNTLGHTVISRYVRASDAPFVADVSSRFDLVWPDGKAWIDQPFSNHNGGHLAFGPDGYLYVGLGDGGSGNDPLHYAQSPTTLLGKMLRIDVAVPDTDPQGYDVPPTNPFVGSGIIPAEVWSFGLRNPWRYSFDNPDLGGTGALVLGDVGQGAWEEIDYEPAGAKGRNYGWRNFEGSHPNITSLPLFSEPATGPIYEYDHGTGRSITGGYIYRGTALPSAYRGRYFFGDFVFGRIWSISVEVATNGEGIAADLMEHTAELGDAAGSPSSFGVDSQGELLLLEYFTGRLYRIVSASAPPITSAPSCSTPDPFIAMGGGTCASGEWLPPGYPVPDVPQSPTSPPSPPSPPSSSSACSTPDPFTVLGGGTCYNGDWLPPGYPTPQAPTAPPPTTPPTPPAAGCSTPDPFVILGGGTCVNGNWLPPGYPASRRDTSSDEHLALTRRFHHFGMVSV